jgi:hypothetical protein
MPLSIADYIDVRLITVLFAYICISSPGPLSEMQGCSVLQGQFEEVEETG